MSRDMSVSHDKGSPPVLSINYPISSHAKLIGEVELEEVKETNVREKIRDMMLKLLESKNKDNETFEKRIDEERKQLKMKYTRNEEIKEGVIQLEGSKKRKIRGDLINPTSKRRKEKGAKFQPSSDGEQE